MNTKSTLIKQINAELIRLNMGMSQKQMFSLSLNALESMLISLKSLKSNQKV